MQLNNCTTVTELVLIGLYNLHGFKSQLVCLLLIAYIVTCLENVLIIVLVIYSRQLHSPMYILLSSLSSCELLSITNFVPKILNDILSRKRSISVIGCITQLNIFGTTGAIISVLYALMTYDRYVAISNPLRYSALLNNRRIITLIISLSLFAFMCVNVVSILLGKLDICGNNIIDHFYCDFAPFVALSYSDITIVKEVAAILSILFTWLPLILIILSYGCILQTILKIPSTTGRKKTFSTCSSHLIVVTIYYGSIISIYSLPSRANSYRINKGVSFVYITVTPLINPIIYTLKNQEIHKALKTRIITLKNVIANF